ncbi:uncharacterized protein LOC108052669 [Drosophila rhopaloa]|uniref:Uncharacterized protein LOC108052669 n=1 Tax=Drosophila rhopaloa TaxID=1041015 RepID=A0A6P4FLD4_DRORH|nr:uncharacterized protein LOC108052669 [Drosophila rhopaloa]
MMGDSFGIGMGKLKSTEPSIGPLEPDNDYYEAETLLQKSKSHHTPQPSWVAWCERNSKPVKRPRPRVVRKLTKWQKNGPMTKKDWKHFCAWAALRTRPREPEPPKPAKLPCVAKYLPCAKKKRHLDEDELRERMLELANPRKVTQKYSITDRPPAYSPVISWGKPPHRDPGRPFKPPFVPVCFPTDELEAEFWAQLRFPVRQAALLGKVTPRILNLSKPRSYPPTPHCPIPERLPDPLDVPPPPRKKFTSREWRLHQIRLIYLSKPVIRKELDYIFYNI